MKLHYKGMEIEHVLNYTSLALIINAAGSYQSPRGENAVVCFVLQRCFSGLCGIYTTAGRINPPMAGSPKRMACGAVEIYQEWSSSHSIGGRAKGGCFPRLPALSSLGHLFSGLPLNPKRTTPVTASREPTCHACVHMPDTAVNCMKRCQQLS